MRGNHYKNKANQMKVAIRNEEDPGRKQRRQLVQTHRIMKGATGTQQKNVGEPSKQRRNR